MDRGLKYEQSARFTQFLQLKGHQYYPDMTAIYSDMLRNELCGVINTSMLPYYGMQIHYNAPWYIYINAAHLIMCETSDAGTSSIEIKPTRGRILEIISQEATAQGAIHEIIRACLPQPIAEEMVPEISRVEEMIAALIT